jgi:hypothetical protein
LEGRYAVQLPRLPAGQTVSGSEQSPSLRGKERTHPARVDDECLTRRATQRRFRAKRRGHQLLGIAHQRIGDPHRGELSSAANDAVPLLRGGLRRAGDHDCVQLGVLLEQPLRPRMARIVGAATVPKHYKEVLPAPDSRALCLERQLCPGIQCIGFSQGKIA